MIKKSKELNELVGILDQAKEDGKRVIFANGCFDLLHVGHIRYLQGAKELGDLLVVAVNSDASVKRIKGQGRPYTSEGERLEILAALECVDYLTLFDDPDVTRLLLTLKPHVQAKGSDYTVDSVPEREVVRSYGGEVAITGDPKDHSSTEIIGKMKE